MSKEEVMEIREEVRQYIDRADEKTLRMIHAMLEVEAEVNWWDSMPVEIKAKVEKAISQADKGEFISHEQMKKNYPQWFMK